MSFQSLKERNILVSNINGVFVGMAMFLLFTILIILGEYPSPGFGLSELNAGLILVPAVISMLVTGPFLGRAISRYGPKPVMILGFVLIALGPSGSPRSTASTYEVGAIAVPMMVGNVAVLISMSNVIVLSVDPKTMGIQTGMNQTFRNLGSALGPVLVTSILASYTFTAGARRVRIPELQPRRVPGRLRAGRSHRGHRPPLLARAPELPVPRGRDSDRAIPAKLQCQRRR